jgi:hypothetical protein
MCAYPELAVTSGAEMAIPGQCDAYSLPQASHFTKLALILIVTLMRFDNVLRKIEDWIKFPRILMVYKGAKYALSALIVHKGTTLTHGHFVAFMRIQTMNQAFLAHRLSTCCVLPLDIADKNTHCRLHRPTTFGRIALRSKFSGLAYASGGQIRCN